MKRIIFSATLILLMLVLCAGCASSDNPTPPSTADRTSVPTTTVTTPVSVPSPAETTAVPVATKGSGDEGPVEVMPSDQQVNFDLTKDRPTSKIYLTYQGGAGERFTQKVSMNVYASDGTLEQYVMSSGQKPIPNDQIIASGTRSGDRCIVYVQSGGVTYKVIDQTVFASG